MSYDPRVRIYCLFGWEGHEDHPELLEAWDEFDVEANREGFDAACAVALERRGIPERHARYATLLVNWNDVEALYHDAEITAELGTST